MILIIKNKKIKYDYVTFKQYESGIVLFGSEVKSLRLRSASIKESFAFVDKNQEIWLHSFHIAKYKKAAIYNHDPLRPKKLLLRVTQIKEISTRIKRKKYTLVPLEIKLVKNKIKVIICLAKGKRKYDKRQALKKNQDLREMQKTFKNIYLR